MVFIYEKYYNLDFYISMLDIYLSGYIFCGWDGDYLNGKILVYQEEKMECNLVYYSEMKKVVNYFLEIC